MKKLLYSVICAGVFFLAMGCNNSAEVKVETKDTTTKDTLRTTDEGIKPPQTNGEF